MKHNLLPLGAALFTMLLSAGCSSRSTHSRLEEKQLDDQFPLTPAATDSAVTVSSIINIQNWNAGTDNILIQSENTDRVFYRLDPATFCTVDSFGIAGQGPDEFIFPKIVKTGNGTEILADVARNRFIDRQSVLNAPQNGFTYNDPFSIRYPIIGFTQLHGPDRSLYIIDLNTSTVIDSLEFKSSDMPSPAIPVNFRAASNGKHIVIVREFCNEITVIDLDENCKFKKTTRYRGAGETSPHKPYYVGLECGNNRFYVLSMKGITFGKNGEPQGNCTIDIYDYDCTPIASITTEIIPRRILLDATRNRILALSPFDDDIHIITDINF